MKPELPPGAWEVLFPRALRLVDDIQRFGGLADPFWTFGGGTVLMLRCGHRLSKDIDILVPDPQYLGYVTPRLSDTAASPTEDYTEMSGSFVKLQFEEGEVDFVARPRCLSWFGTETGFWSRSRIPGPVLERALKPSPPLATCRVWRTASGLPALILRR